MYTDDEVTPVIDLVNQNRTLEELVLVWFDTSSDCIAALRRLFSALHENSTLQKIEVEICNLMDHSSNYVTHFMTTHYKDLTLDCRIKYVRYW